MRKAQRQGNDDTRGDGEKSSALCLPAALSGCLLVCMAAGCGTDFGSKQLGDPLLGAHAAPKPLETANTPNSNPAVTQATAGPLPALPSSYSAVGTAPVAGGETATSENPRALRMAAEPVAPVSPPASGAVRAAAPAVTVGNPEPTPSGNTSNFTKPPPPPPPMPSGTAANVRTYEDAQQFLQQHRVSWQHLSMDEGQWKFECGVPNPSNPRLNRHYATSRAFPDPLSAIREVITQIEKNGS